MNSAEKLKHEFENLKQKPLTDFGYSIELSNKSDIYNWIITLIGAKDSPYSDGIFFLKLVFSQDYPSHPPKIFFLTPIYHPNIRKSNGFVDVNFIRDYAWKETTSVKEILTKLYSIFYIINPHRACADPFSKEQSEQYKMDRGLYELKAKYFTLKYANIKSFNDFKWYNWDFSVDSNNLNSLISALKNKKIKICFNVNGTSEFWMDYLSNELARDAIRKFMFMNYFSQDINYVLCVYKGRKINLNETLEENGLEDQSHITIIYGVEF